jgi:hypothetical protein
MSDVLSARSPPFLAEEDDHANNDFSSNSRPAVRGLRKSLPIEMGLAILSRFRRAQNMPLSFSTEELHMLLELAEPIAHAIGAWSLI